MTYTDLPADRISDGAASAHNQARHTSATTVSGEARIDLTDIVGERVITVRAKVTIGGADYTATQEVSFGNGPLSVFKAPVGTSSPYLTWDEAYQACNGTVYGGDHSTGWTSGAYVGGGKMPTRAEYQAVSPYYTGGTVYNDNPNAQGAACAAGWPVYWYWTGEAYGADVAFFVDLVDGFDIGAYNVSVYDPVACRR